MESTAATQSQLSPLPSPHEVTMYLAPSKEITTWWCMICRNKLFSSHHKLIQIDEEGAPKVFKPPIIIPCKRCRSSWKVIEIM